MNKQDILNIKKWYNYNENKVGLVELEIMENLENSKLTEWINVLNECLKSNFAQMIVFVIFDRKNEITYEFQIMEDCIKEIRRDGIISIENVIMPLIEKRMCENLCTDIKMEKIVNILINDEKTIATMESCTGGLVASEITNVSGASSILNESYVSYCNEAKIKFGVPEDVIEKYSVYSFETAVAMAKAVKNKANSNFGVGVTGQLGRIDPNNPGSPNNNIWYSICGDNVEEKCRIFIQNDLLPRSEKKKIVIREIVESLYGLL